MDRLAFKKCPLCGFCWPDLPAFVTDASLRVNGYQACPTLPELGMIMVTHKTAACNTTLAVVAESLAALYDGTQYGRRLTSTDACEGRCQHPDDIEACTAECDMAWVRHALQWLRRHELPPHLRPIP